MPFITTYVYDQFNPLSLLPLTPIISPFNNPKDLKVKSTNKQKKLRENCKWKKWENTVLHFVKMLNHDSSQIRFWSDLADIDNDDYNPRKGWTLVPKKNVHSGNCTHRWTTRGCPWDTFPDIYYVWFLSRAINHGATVPKESKVQKRGDESLTFLLGMSQSLITFFVFWNLHTHPRMEIQSALNNALHKTMHQQSNTRLVLKWSL